MRRFFIRIQMLPFWITKMIYYSHRGRETPPKIQKEEYKMIRFLFWAIAFRFLFRVIYRAVYHDLYGQFETESAAYDAEEPAMAAEAAEEFAAYEAEEDAPILRFPALRETASGLWA